MRRTVMVCALGIGLVTQVAFSSPLPGDVFVEVGMKINRTLQGDGGSSGVLTIPASLDLTHAVRAEVTVEYANVHLGVNGLSVRINGHHGVPIPFPASVPALKCPVKPEGDQSHIYQMPVVTIAVPVTDFHAGKTNSCEFTTPDKGENHKAFTQVYGATFRIYYDPSAKAHVTGRLTSPAAHHAVGTDVKLAVALNGRASRVEYVGLYDDLDYNGDGVYRDWVYSYRDGKLANNMATATQAPFDAVWNTAWVPDQDTPMELAARIVGDDGVIYMTESVKGITFSRGDLAVELCRPYGLLNGFSTCVYGKPGYIYTAETRNKTEYFGVTGSMTHLAQARLFFACWKRGSSPQMALNGARLADIAIDGKGSQYVTLPLNPASALVSGTNTLVLVNATDGGTDIEWPGIQVLIQYHR